MGLTATTRTGATCAIVAIRGVIATRAKGDELRGLNCGIFPSDSGSFRHWCYWVVQSIQATIEGVHEVLGIEATTRVLYIREAHPAKHGVGIGLILEGFISEEAA